MANIWTEVARSRLSEDTENAMKPQRMAGRHRSTQASVLLYKSEYCYPKKHEI